MCAKCDEAPAGPGGVLCAACVDKLVELARNYWTTGPGAQMSPVPLR